MPKHFKVDKDFHNTRFDKWFKKNVIDVPQSLLEKIIRKNQIKINRKRAKTAYKLQTGDLIDVYNLEKFSSSLKNQTKKYQASKKDLRNYNDFILENNDNFIVINKPSGVAVQAGTKSFKNVIDIFRNSKYFSDSKPYIVHRLDKETSGILIIAKNREYAQLFTSLFRIRKIHKTYLAIVHGKFPIKIKKMEDNLVYIEKNKKIIQKALSYVKLLRQNHKHSLIELNPITGRKHQLRRQLYNLGFPIVGDEKYFLGKDKYDKSTKNKHLMLHAYKIKFMINNLKYNFKAHVNLEFDNLLKKSF